MPKSESEALLRSPPEADASYRINDDEGCMGLI